MNFYNPYQQPMNYPQPMDNLAQLRQQQYPQYQAQQFQQQQQMGNGSIIRVKNEEEARNYLVAPNCYVIMLDANLPRIYLKKADATGKADFEIYEKPTNTSQTEQPEGKPENPNDEVITLGKLKFILSSLGLLPAKGKEKKEESVNE